MRGFGKGGRAAEAHYDLFEDWGLIEASFAQQYGIRLRHEDDMPFGEFATLLSGLNGDTPLGATVRIRTERDRKAIRKFSREQRRIYNDWHRRRAKAVTREEYEAAMKGLSQAFRSLGGEK